MPGIDTTHARGPVLAPAGLDTFARPERTRARGGLQTLLITGLLPLLLGAAGPANAGETAANDPPPHELSIDHIANQPASMVTCSYGYWAEKSGDHATANAIFDRCIEAGFVGAMIWKALLYEEGNGVAQDSAKAADLLRRAATSGDSSYATLGKLHYATALYLGKGVPRDEAEALKWFRQAADEGSEEAQAFLRTGHHTGDRDLQGRGVGEQPSQIQGQRLEKTAPAAEPSEPAGLGSWLVVALAAAFVAGLLHQAVGRRRPASLSSRRIAAQGA